MSRSQTLASLLNLRLKEGCDIVGGADDDALDLLLSTYMEAEGHGPNSPELPEWDEEDHNEGFEGHFSGNDVTFDEPAGELCSNDPDHLELFDSTGDDFYDPFEDENLESPLPLASQPVASSQDDTPPTSLPDVSGSSSVSQAGSSSASQASSSSASQAGSSSTSQASNSSALQPSSRHRTPRENLEKFWVTGCGCKLNKGQPCFTKFSREHYEDSIDQCCSLTKAELDLVLLGQIMAHISNEDDVGPKSKHPYAPRQRSRLSFYHHGVKVCKVTFLILHGVALSYSKKAENSLWRTCTFNFKIPIIMKAFSLYTSTTTGKDRFHALKAHYIATGLTLRTHGNYKRLPHNTLSFRDVENVVKFLRSYAETHAILLPGRIPGYKRDDLKLLPSSTTKKSVWSQYKAACEEAGLRAAAYNTFCALWRRLVPEITVMKPMSDLCWVCQQNSTSLMRAANTPDEEKSEIVKAAQAHLKLATEARDYLKTQVEQSKSCIKDCFTDQGLVVPAVGACVPPNTNDITVHFSFDMAQQVHFPCDPQQPGPMYFLTPRKCGIFGVCCEAIPRQVNYLIDEGQNIGKGANCIISLLHHFLSTHNLGEASLHFHADNCSGQNKNRYMMQYLAWRVESGLNQRIEISFLVVGHTKFSPDWCFGLVKQAFRRTKVGCLDDIARVVNTSATVNYAQLVGQEDGTVYVPQYDWSSFFAPIFKRNAFAGIKCLHHLVFEKGKHGKVMVREHKDSAVEVIDTLTKDHLDWHPSPDELPRVIQPPGLSRERQTYLFEKIREFCPEESKNIVCPDPNCHTSFSESPSSSPLPSSPESPLPPPTPKRPRRSRS